MSNHHHKKYHITAEEIFKHKFIKEFVAFKHDSEGFVRGAISFSGSWKDWLGVAGLSSTFVAVGAILSAVALVGLVSSIASLGIGLAIALAAIGAEVGYTLYRSKKKSHEYHRVSNFLAKEGVEDDIKNIADLLADLYHAQLSECKSKEDAEGLALAYLQAIEYELLKNKDFKYEDLLHAGSLQAILAKNAMHVAKKSLHSLITHAALYCAENDKFYASEHSKPEKYGVILFKTKVELDDFRIMTGKLKGPHHIGKFSKVRSSDAESIRHGKFFKHHQQHQHKVIEKETADDMSLEVSLRHK